MGKGENSLSGPPWGLTPLEEGWQIQVHSGQPGEFEASQGNLVRLSTTKKAFF